VGIAKSGPLGDAAVGNCPLVGSSAEINRLPLQRLAWKVIVSSNWGHEGLFAGFADPGARCAGSGDAPAGGDPAVWGIDGDVDALATTPAREGESGGVTPTRSTRSEDGRLAGRPGAPLGGAARCDARGALPVVGSDERGSGEPRDDESNDHSALRVDEKKSLGGRASATRSSGRPGGRRPARSRLTAASGSTRPAATSG
jgi:hypothetical protein